MKTNDLKWVCVAQYPSNDLKWVCVAQYPTNDLEWICVADYPTNDLQWICVAQYPTNDLQWVCVAGCFPKSELVHTNPDTYVPIGSLNVGDKIFSWDEEYRKPQYTAITKIHKYKVYGITCFNNNMWVSLCHPLMVIENKEKNILIPKWKIAHEINVGDYLIGTNGKYIPVKSKIHREYPLGTEVLSLSTDSGLPFMVGDCVVRAENAQDSIILANTPITQKLFAA